jgi:iron complex transport system substrate-binding protein
MAWYVLWFVGLSIGLAGCTGSSPESVEDATRTNKARPAETVAFGRCRVRYAKGFTITYREGYKVVAVLEPGRIEGARVMNTFILVPRGTHPRVTEKGAVIEVPVRRAVLRSASHVPFFSLLGITDRIVGITQGRYVNDPEVAERIRQGLIREVGVGSGMTAQFNMERLLTLHPDFILTWWTNNPAYAAHIKAAETGLPVALAADYEETTMLGRTEWVKFVAAFFDAEPQAERVFDDIERRYLEVRRKVERITDRPTVVHGSGYRGAWYIAGGKSYFANLVRDAGGRYVWDDDHGTGSRPVNMETAMMRSRNADYWISPNESWVSLASVAAEDSRFRFFRSFHTGRIYTTNGKIGPGGGNDYYQSSVAHPDLLLADMISILHPEAITGHRLIWHVHLPATMPKQRDSRQGTEK